MLYDILPPIILFTSFAGVITIISRVALRIKKQQFNEQIKLEGVARNEVPADTMLQPDTKGLHLAKNRLALVPQMMKQTVSQTKSLVAEKKERLKNRRAYKATQEEQMPEPQHVEEEVKQEEDQEEVGTIQIPHTSWRERISNKLSASTRGVSSFKQRLAERRAAKRAAKEEISVATLDLAEEEETPATPILRTAEPRPLITPKPLTPVQGIQAKITRKIMPEKKKDEAQVRPGIISNILKKEIKGEVDSPLEKAASALQAGKYEQVEDILVPFLMKHAGNTKAYMLLGRAALGRNEWDEAVEIFNQVVKINEEQPGAHAALGYAALRAGRFTVALQSLQRAHDEDPENIEVLESLLTIAKRMDNKVLQRSVMEDLVQLKPDKYTIAQKA